MKKTFLLAGLGIGIMAITAVSVAYAAGGNYTAWRASVSGNGRVAEIVNEKNFDQFTQMHQLMVDGKYDEAQKIRTDLGLGKGTGKGSGGCGMHGANGQGGGCPMHNSGKAQGESFSDANSNGVCDHAE